MKIVFATNNQHKLQEIRDILGSDYEVVSLKEIGCDVDIPETGNTLEENALQRHNISTTTTISVVLLMIPAWK